ncbi:MAG: hypothetical protein K2X03_30630 [Bryobacteraceae bacterium]|nr:hypothetical protein [Bryobacteraceae bacterium]
MPDELGDKIKTNFEDALRLRLPRRTHLVLRIDGRRFHTFTKQLARPYDFGLAAALDTAAMALAAEMSGCRLGFGQSDEYSFLLTDFGSEHEKMWFDGNVQKIVSVAASIFTAHFTRAFALATFDARVMVIPRRADVADYFIWRQTDASTNSLNMLASAHYAHEELAGKSAAEKHDLLHAKGLNWAKQETSFKRGRIIRPASGGWEVDPEPPVFTRDRGYLLQLFPEAD